MSRMTWVKSSIYGALIVFLFLIPVFITSPYQLHILIMSGINIILASSLRLVATSGQLTLAHGGMASMGAYTSCLLVMKASLSSWVALAMGGLAAGIAALMVAYPFVRLKGVYFAMATVFLSEVIRLIAEQWRSLTGGGEGIFNIPGPDPIDILGLVNIDFSSRADFYYFVLVLTLLCLLVLYLIEYSPIGLNLSSIAQADWLAESVGINTARLKVIVFCISCAIAGVVGAVYSQYVSAMTSDTFSFFFTIYIVVYMIVGGAERFSGPILGALVLTIVPEFFRGLKEYVPFLYAAVLMGVMFFLPEGLVGLPQRLRKLIMKGPNYA